VAAWLVVRDLSGAMWMWMWMWCSGALLRCPALWSSNVLIGTIGGCGFRDCGCVCDCDSGGDCSIVFAF